MLDWFKAHPPVVHLLWLIAIAIGGVLGAYLNTLPIIAPSANAGLASALVYLLKVVFPLVMDALKQEEPAAQ